MTSYYKLSSHWSANKSLTFNKPVNIRYFIKYFVKLVFLCMYLLVMTLWRISFRVSRRSYLRNYCKSNRLFEMPSLNLFNISMYNISMYKKCSKILNFALNVLRLDNDFINYNYKLHLKRHYCQFVKNFNNYLYMVTKKLLLILFL